jgi:hypothetical protein
VLAHIEDDQPRDDTYAANKREKVASHKHTSVTATRQEPGARSA